MPLALTRFLAGGAATAPDFDRAAQGRAAHEPFDNVQSINQQHPSQLAIQRVMLQFSGA